MDLSNYVSLEDLKKYGDKKLNIFFYRICGTGMGAAASLLKQAGHHVVGADLSYSPPMSTYLEQDGVTCLDLKKITQEDLRKYDLIVVGNSIPRTSDYAKMIEESGAKFTSFPSLLGGLVLHRQNVVGIAGTHGKTTTTYYLVQLLEALGHKPGYVIGGILDDRPPSAIGDGSYFVIESDEYDSAYFEKYSKFLSYEVDHLVLTSLEFDHADIFNSLEDIKNEFRKLFKQRTIASYIYNSEYPACVELSREISPSIQQQFFALDSQIGPKEISNDLTSSQFVLELGGSEHVFKTSIIGIQNILNLSSCLKFLYSQGYGVEKLKQASLKLEQVKRRQEYRGSYKNSPVIDDFAHHPRAVSLTIDSIRKTYPGRPLLVVFDPISATARSNIFQNEFAQSLYSAQSVIVTQNNLKTTAKSGSDLDLNQLTSDLKQHNISARIAADLKELRLHIEDLKQDDSIILVLSNRTCLGLWESDFVQELL
jgi:UDP-N-acetylmuramate: L-alanyl-gamma-D-glutamyl-meso-diaminopimelate ligase